MEVQARGMGNTEVLNESAEQAYSLRERSRRCTSLGPSKYLLK